MTITKTEKTLIWLFIFTAIGVLGLRMNYITLLNNDCKMPVSWTYDDYESFPFHILTDDIKSFNYWYLSDIFGVKGKSMYSLGDILIVVSMVGVLLFSIKFWIDKKHG